MAGLAYRLALSFRQDYLWVLILNHVILSLAPVRVRAPRSSGSGFWSQQREIPDGLNSVYCTFTSTIIVASSPPQQSQQSQLLVSAFLTSRLGRIHIKASCDDISSFSYSGTRTSMGGSLAQPSISGPQMS